jgi:predicted transcriptional regulator with HTH domain
MRMCKYEAVLSCGALAILSDKDKIEPNELLFLLHVALQSRVRRLVLSTLMRRGAWLSISEIAHQTGLSPTQVSGALRGIRGQYDPKYSLLRLGIVSVSDPKPSDTRHWKSYEFSCKDRVVLEVTERILHRYQSHGEQ